MRVAFFHPAFRLPGGAEILCIDEAHLLRSTGAEVTLVTLDYDPQIWNERLHGLPIDVVGKHHWTSVFTAFSRRAKLFVRGRRAGRRMRGCDVAVAHNHPCSTMLGASLFAGRRVWQCNEPVRRIHLRAANPRLTARVEALAPGEIPDDFASRAWIPKLSAYDRSMALGRSRAREVRFDRLMTSRLDHVYAISEFSRDNARRIHGRCAQEVVYPSVRFPERRWERSGPSADRLQVLTHSRLETNKNVDAVVRGFALFAREHPAAHLHIVGDGPRRADIEECAAELMPSTNYTFHGYLSQSRLDEVRARCDVFALLTLDEPFGMVFPEAAACGLLLIGPDHGGPLEILEGGALGACIDPFSPTALCAAFERVGALSAAEASGLRSRAERACRERFSAAAVLPRLRHAVFEGTC